MRLVHDQSLREFAAEGGCDFRDQSLIDRQGLLVCLRGIPQHSPVRFVGTQRWPKSSDVEVVAEQAALFDFVIA